MRQLSSVWNGTFSSLLKLFEYATLPIYHFGKGTPFFEGKFLFNYFHTCYAVKIRHPYHVLFRGGGGGGRSGVGDFLLGLSLPRIICDTHGLLATTCKFSSSSWYFWPREEFFNVTGSSMNYLWRKQTVDFLF